MTDAQCELDDDFVGFVGGDELEEQEELEIELDEDYGGDM